MKSKFLFIVVLISCFSIKIFCDQLYVESGNKKIYIGMAVSDSVKILGIPVYIEEEIISSDIIYITNQFKDITIKYYSKNTAKELINIVLYIEINNSVFADMYGNKIGFKFKLPDLKIEDYSNISGINCEFELVMDKNNIYSQWKKVSRAEWGYTTHSVVYYNFDINGLLRKLRIVAKVY